MKITTETVLYGIRKGETERYAEELLASNRSPEVYEKIKKIAAKDGWHSFRIGTVTLGEIPNFAATINR